MESFIPISPGEQLKITVEAESRNQVISTQQIQCTHGKDQLEYNFGGSILKLDYNEEVCREMCFLKSLYKSCNCTLLIGWNYTQSECLEKFEYRKCIQKTIEDDDEYMENIVKGCKKSCYPLCQNSYYRLNTDRTLKFPTVHYLLQELYAMANQTMQDPLVRKLLKMAEDELLRPRKPEERIKEESVAEHVAQLRVLSDKGVETVYHVEVAVGVSAMLGYVGGLLGLWMGVSAMTMVDIGEWLARLMYKIRPRQNSTVHP